MKHFESVSKYASDVAILKKYNEFTYKLTLCRSLRKKGFEYSKRVRVTGVNDSKLCNNISRAKSKVLEYALCNEFEYFVTLTINKDKHNRYDLKSYYKTFSKFLNNYNYRYSVKVDYLLIPEKHKDGAWHLHGLIKGLPLQHLKRNEHGYLDWTHYSNKFGFISLDPIRSIEKVSRYITKYINKELESTIKELGAHLYYVSKGLKKSKEIKRGTLFADSIPYDFENDYVKIKWLKNGNIAELLID